MKQLLTSLGKLLLLVLLVSSTVFSQTQTKMVEWAKDPISTSNAKSSKLLLQDRIDGVEIEDIFVAGNSVTIGQPFAAGDDWVETLSACVKNVSREKISAIQITFSFPELGNASPDFVICYGCAGSERQKGVQPGEEVELKCPGGGMYEWVKQKVAEKGISRIVRIQIREMYVTLPDGTKWFSGCIKTADPKNACPSNPPQPRE